MNKWEKRASFFVICLMFAILSDTVLYEENMQDRTAALIAIVFISGAVGRFY